MVTLFTHLGSRVTTKTKQVSEVCLSLEDIEFAGISSVDKKLSFILEFMIVMISRVLIY